MSFGPSQRACHRNSSTESKSCCIQAVGASMFHRIDCQELKLPHNSLGVAGRSLLQGSHRIKAPNSQACGVVGPPATGTCGAHSSAPAPLASFFGTGHFFILPSQQMTFSTRLLALLSINIGLYVALSNHTSNTHSIAPVSNTDCVVSYLCLNSERKILLVQFW